VLEAKTKKTTKEAGDQLIQVREECDQDPGDSFGSREKSSGQNIF
jgi:hypothetical protein